MPSFVAAHPEEKCDLLFIDGGHDYDIAKADIENFKPLARKDSLVIMDDSNMGEVEQAWNETMDAGLIEEHERNLESSSCEGVVENVVNGILEKWSHIHTYMHASISTGRYVI